MNSFLRRYNLNRKKKLLSRIIDFSSQIIDPSKEFYYAWLVIISIAVMYNYIFIIARTGFSLLQSSSLALWLTLDYLSDLVYILDILVRFRTGMLFSVNVDN